MLKKNTKKNKKKCWGTLSESKCTSPIFCSGSGPFASALVFILVILICILFIWASSKQLMNRLHVYCISRDNDSIRIVLTYSTCVIPLQYSILLLEHIIEMQSIDCKFVSFAFYEHLNDQPIETWMSNWYLMQRNNTEISNIKNKHNAELQRADPGTKVTG